MIYLDHNATTPICPEAAEEMERCLREVHGNPSCTHALGREAAQTIDRARGLVAGLIGADAERIVFTGCGSEANNLALKGVCRHYRDQGRHLIISAVEHPSVIEPALYLKREGWELTVLPVDGEGLVDPQELRQALRPDTVLVSVMQANNETGAIQPIAELAAILRESRALLHCDAAQSCGKIPVDVNDLGVDLLTVVGHKLYAPKGIGALYVKQGVSLEPLIHGAGHERGLRAGTENVVHIAGFGAACREAGRRLQTDPLRMRELRDRLEKLLRDELPELVLNGPKSNRLPNTLNVSFPGIPGARILDGAIEIAASTGAACHSDRVQLSPVLAAMGVDPQVGMGAIRLTLGRDTTREQIDEAARMLIDSVKLLR